MATTVVSDACVSGEIPNPTSGEVDNRHAPSSLLEPGAPRAPPLRDNARQACLGRPRRRSRRRTPSCWRARQHLGLKSVRRSALRSGRPASQPGQEFLLADFSFRAGLADGEELVNCPQLGRHERAYRDPTRQSSTNPRREVVRRAWPCGQRVRGSALLSPHQMQPCTRRQKFWPHTLVSLR